LIILLFSIKPPIPISISKDVLDQDRYSNKAGIQLMLVIIILDEKYI